MLWPRLSPLRIGIVVALLVASIHYRGCNYLDQIDLRTIDFRLLQRGAERGSDEIVIVAVDDVSINAIGQWPWPRRTIARLIDRLTALDAAVIAFDIVWPEASTSQDDGALAEAIKRSGRVVLGYFFDFDRASTRFERLPSTYDLSPTRGGGVAHVLHATGIYVSVPEITGAARYAGHFNFRPDADGYLRRVPFAIVYRDQIAMPLALAAMKAWRPGERTAIRIEPHGVDRVEFGDIQIPVGEDGHLLVNYRGPRGTFTHIPAVEVLNGTVTPARIRGKVVFAGVTASALYDMRVTPFDAELPGVEVHANVLDNILRRDFLSRPAALVRASEALVIVGVALLTGLVTGRVRGLASAAAALVLVVAYLAGTQWYFLVSGTPISILYPLLTIALTYTVVSLHQFLVVDAEKRENQRFLELYLSPTLARALSEQPDLLRASGDKRELTILFSDIRGFTTISEQLDPRDLVELLNTYLGEMTEIIRSQNDGTVRYVGDAIMAVWGGPLPQPDHAERGCRVALEMLGRLRELEPQWKARGWPPIRVGIGLNTGPMIFGNLGSARHLSFEIVGDHANLGARLEGLTKHYGASIIASESTVTAARSLLTVRELDFVRVKGKGNPVRIFEILGFADERERWAVLVERFNAALWAYRERRWEDAIQSFEAVLEVAPGDGPALLYLERCRAMLTSPPPAEWDGITVMDAK